MADRNRPKPRAIAPIVAVIPDCIKANPIAERAADPLNAFTTPFCFILSSIKYKAGTMFNAKSFYCRKIYK